MKKLNLLLGILIGLLITSCSSDDGNPPNENQAPKFVKKITKAATSTSLETTTTFNYNIDNLLIGRQYTEGNINSSRQITYDSNNRVTDISNENQSGNNTTQFEYNSNGKLMSIISPNDDAVFNYNGNVVTITGTVNNHLGVSIEFELDSNGKVISTEYYQNGFIKTFEYDSNDNIKTIKGILNTQTLYEINLSYDDKINPFYGQYESIYLEKFINYFFPDDSVFISSFTRDYNFPFHKNNITSIVKNENNTTISRSSSNSYDNDNFLINVDVNFTQGTYTNSHSYSLEYYE